jgi:2-iminobutanoate/2-iminopropanoate deaminase
MIREIIRGAAFDLLGALEGADVRSYSPRGHDLCVGLPPFDPKTGEVVDAPIERETELVLEQLKLCVDAAGSSMEKVLKCSVYCTSLEKFGALNEIYARYFPKNPPARIFVNVQA